MSRVGRQPIPVPSGVTVSIVGKSMVVKGPKGELSAAWPENVSATVEDNAVVVTVRDPEIHTDRALWGLWRNLIRNMVEGVSTGFSKTLEFIGVGYKVAVSGQTVTMNVGFSHPVIINLPAGIAASAEKNMLTLSGIDKQLVGEMAAQIRRIRKPEPYKGKGIKYTTETIRRKAGKAVKAVGK